jgi:SAM-dependent methyltransferase
MPVKRLSCPVCESDEHKLDPKASQLLALGEPFAVVICSRCGLRRLEPMPTDEEYRLLYEGGYFGVPFDSETPTWISEYPPVEYEEALTEARISAYAARLRRLAAIYPRRGAMLDVGMATGEFASMAIADGWRVAGLELSAEACRTARDRGIDAHCGGLLDCRLERRFDVVHLHHVFEHFTQPLAALGKLKSLLSDGALLVLEVPNQFESWTRRLVNAIRRVTSTDAPRTVLSIHHPYFYTQSSLSKLLISHGFDVVWLQTYFPERWAGPAYRHLLQAIDYLADRVGSYGENVEIAARSRSGRSPATES